MSPILIFTEKLLAWAFFLLFAVPVSVIAIYWTLQDPVPLVVKQIEIKAPIQAVAGGSIMVPREYCTDGKYDGIVNRFISDTIVYRLTDTPITKSKGCFERDFVVSVPSILPPGHYVYNSRIIYRINPLKTKIVELPPIPFTVIAAQQGR